jgi:hypothetical protein
MRRLLLLGAIFLGLAAQAQASAGARMTFGFYVDHATGRIDQRYQMWASSSLEPVVSGTVQVHGAGLCGGWFGCSSYDPGAGGAAIHADTRDTFLFEEGHLVDWEMLTGRDRRILAHVWGVYGKPWNNSPVLGQRRGDEDGLTADFGGAYRSCAEGDHAQGLAIGDAPVITLHNTCALIRRWL